MPNKLGIHLPNGQLRDYAVYELGVSHYTMLHGELYLLPRTLEASDGVVLVRFYLPAWTERNPRQWAAECAGIWDSNAQLRQTERVHFTPANEMNLALEAFGAGQEYRQPECETRGHYQRINDWLLAWLDEFARRTGCPAARLHWPAVAYGHSDDNPDRGFVGLEECRASVDAYGVLDCHPYWYVAGQIDSEWYGHRFVRLHGLFPDKPIFCSEAGNFNVTSPTTAGEIVSWFDSLYRYPYVIGGTPFIWEDPTGAHSPNDWSRNKAIGRAVRDAYKPDAPAWHPGTGEGGIDVGSDERRRYAMDIWARAGVPANPDGALFRAWYDAYNRGDYWGRPEEPEHPSESGRYVVQAFASRIAYYDTKTGKVGQGLPPF